MALVPGGTQLQMAAWPALPSPAAGPRMHQAGMSSGNGLPLSRGCASGFPFAAPARMFCNEFGESIHSGKNPGVECFLPAGVWVRGCRAAGWAGAGWGGGEMGRGRCWLPDWPSPQPSGTLAAFELFFCLSACPSGLEKLAGSG